MQKQSIYPVLSRIAKRYLCSAASSLDTEREASLEARIQTKFRGKMDADTLEQLTVSNQYLKITTYSDMLCDSI